MTQEQLNDLYGYLGGIAAVKSELLSLARMIHSGQYGKEETLRALNKKRQLLNDMYNNICVILSETEEGQLHAKMINEQLNNEQL